LNLFIFNPARNESIRVSHVTCLTSSKTKKATNGIKKSNGVHEEIDGVQEETPSYIIWVIFT